jgi:hypothetical protein
VKINALPIAEIQIRDSIAVEIEKERASHIVIAASGDVDT